MVTTSLSSLRRLSAPLFSLFAVSVAVAQPTFTVQPIPVRSGFSAGNGLIAVSPHGTFFITQEVDAEKKPHYFLHGPTLSTTPQDLNGSAGPYGPNTNGQYWPGKFILVNDKGLTIAQLQTSSNGPITNYLYSHEQHELTDLNLPGPGFTPTSLDDIDQIGGIALTNLGSLPERVDADGAVKTITFNGDYTNVQIVSGPIVTDDDWVIGTFTGVNRQGRSITSGFTYKPGAPANIFGNETSVAGINDSDLVIGYGYYSGYRTWYGIVWDAFGNIQYFLGAQYFQTLNMLGIDDVNNTLGYQESTGNPLMLWTGGRDYPYNFSSLVTSGTYSDPVYNAAIDLNGNVYYNVQVPGGMQGWIATPN